MASERFENVGFDAVYQEGNTLFKGKLICRMDINNPAEIHPEYLVTGMANFLRKTEYDENVTGFCIDREAHPNAPDKDEYESKNIFVLCMRNKNG